MDTSVAEVVNMDAVADEMDVVDGRTSERTITLCVQYERPNGLSRYMASFGVDLSLPDFVSALWTSIRNNEFANWLGVPESDEPLRIIVQTQVY
jgi:hypothetical protein